MMVFGAWIEMVLEGVEGRKRRACSLRGWLGLRMPWVGLWWGLDVKKVGRDIGCAGVWGWGLSDRLRDIFKLR